LIRILNLGVGCGPPHELLGLDPHVAQVLQQAQEHARLVARGRDGAGQHERGVQRAHVAMVHVAHDAADEEVGVAAGKRARGVGQRQGAAQPQVFAQHQRIDARG
jgi:hypothetical protein